MPGLLPVIRSAVQTLPVFTDFLAAVTCPAGSGTLTLCAYSGIVTKGAGRFVRKRFHDIVTINIRTDGLPFLLAFTVGAFTAAIAERAFSVGDVRADRAGCCIVPWTALFKSDATESGNNDECHNN